MFKLTRYFVSEKLKKKTVIIKEKKNVLAPGFPQCYRNDPELNKCLVEATNHPKIRESLLIGKPELGIPKISPFHIKELTLREGSNSFTFRANLSNVILHGLETYKFSKFE